MNGLPGQILQDLIDAGGTLPAESVAPDHPSRSQRLYDLRSAGWIVLEYRLTEEGVKRHAAPPREAASRRKTWGPRADVLNAIDAALRYPLVATDEQIEALKQQAEQDRCFGEGG